jgi:large subunit ribosomal protein L29
MKSSEYRGMSDDQLELSRKDVVKNIFHLRFQSATDRLETPSEVKKARRELARILTIQRERTLVKERATEAQQAQAKAKSRQEAWQKMVELRRANKLKGRETAQGKAEVKTTEKKSGSGKKKEKKDGVAK